MITPSPPPPLFDLEEFDHIGSDGSLSPSPERTLAHPSAPAVVHPDYASTSTLSDISASPFALSLNFSEDPTATSVLSPDFDNDHTNTDNVFEKHPRFFFEDGSVTFLVNATLYFFPQHFGTGKVSKGTDRLTIPIHLEDINEAEFDAFLSVLYPSKFDEPDVNTIEGWTSVLHLASKWNFNSMRRLAIKRLSPIASPVDKLALGRTHAIDAWIIPACEALCIRKDPLSIAEGRRLLADDIVFIARVREEARNAAWVRRYATSPSEWPIVLPEDVTEHLKVLRSDTQGDFHNVQGGSQKNSAPIVEEENASLVGCAPPIVQASEQVRDIDYNTRMATRDQPGEQSLPVGWECRVIHPSRRVYYVDHNTRTTTWSRPPASGSGTNSVTNKEVDRVVESMSDEDTGGHSDCAAAAVTPGSAAKGEASKTAIDHSPPSPSTSDPATTHVTQSQTPALASSLADGIAVSGTSTFNWGGRVASASSLSAWMSQHGDSLHLRASPQPKRPVPLNDLVKELAERVLYMRSIQGLDEAISLCDAALDLSSMPVDPDQESLLLTLSSALITRFDRVGDHHDIRSAVDRLCGIAVARRAWINQAESAIEINDMATNHLQVYNVSGHISDLNTALTLYRKALVLLPEPHSFQPSIMGNLASALLGLSDQTSRPADLDEAIAFGRQALREFPASHADRSTIMNTLAGAFRGSFSIKGQLVDLDEAVSLFRDAMVLRPTSHPRRANTLLDLANALHIRFTQTGHLADLNEAVSLCREALVLRPAPHPKRAVSISNLGVVLDTRFESAGQISDLDEAILLHRDALTLYPAHYPKRRTMVLHLAGSLHSRFTQTGHLVDLDEGVSLLREVLELLPSTNPGRALALTNLGNALYSRFGQTGRLEELDEAILQHRNALDLRPVPHPDRSTSLNNLASALDDRFAETGQLANLDEAIFLHRVALDLRPVPHSKRSSSLNNLACALQTRFIHTHQLIDLDESILLHRDAIVLRPAPNPRRATSLNNLANALYNRFRETDHLADLDEAISLHQDALDLHHVSHPGRSVSFNNLGNILCARFDLTHQLVDLDKALSFFREAL
ncbi:hypothetical protein EW146_g9340 [Bondarzewia mesenterica]|uniref:WW domain-containing protein n=1 Tax=Bondarzewia mesenterica TaxID=1095465 RepID=A0A4S4L8M2_9AGAM|nr:hypothetical protein EW146_g9340 [Bondarzewia mesenterica]